MIMYACKMHIRTIVFMELLAVKHTFPILIRLKKRILNISFGFILTGIYYSLGYLLPLLVHNFVPSYKSNVGTPGLDMLSIILIGLGGLIWLITSLIKTFKIENRPFYIGALIANIIVWLFLIIIIIYT